MADPGALGAPVPAPAVGGRPVSEPRRLYLLRHAKAEPTAPGGDFDRPLAHKGIAGCALISEFIRASQIAPDLVLCSSARRTRQTVETIGAALPAEVPVLTEDRLYLASAGGLLDRLREVDDGVPSVLLVGHNPSIHELAVGLLHSGEQPSLPTFPTAGLAVEELTVPRWVELGPHTARLISFVTPRGLAGATHA
jgi:phosphohistidine phosphatase